MKRTAIKISHDSDIRRTCRVPTGPPCFQVTPHSAQPIFVIGTSVDEGISFKELSDLVQELFFSDSRNQKGFIVQYRDDENDDITVTSDMELAGALGFFAEKQLLPRLSILDTTAKVVPSPPPYPVFPPPIAYDTRKALCKEIEDGIKLRRVAMSSSKPIPKMTAQDMRLFQLAALSNMGYHDVTYNNQLLEMSKGNIALVLQDLMMIPK